MAKSGNDRIDKLFADKNAVPIGSDETDTVAIMMVQDLLYGHGFSRGTGFGTSTYGEFSTVAGVMTHNFKKRNKIRQNEGSPVIDHTTMAALVNVPAIGPRGNPIVSRAYVTMVLDLPFTGLTKLVSLVSMAAEANGRFDNLNRNHDHAGLSYGIIQWAQRPKRLYEILKLYSDKQPKLFQSVFGGKKRAAGALAYAQKGDAGLNANGDALDPTYEFTKAVWVQRFKQAAWKPVFQKLQIQLALADFHKIVVAIQIYATLMKSERAMGFMADLTNQHGNDAKLFYQNVVTVGMTQKAAMQALATRSIEKLKEIFGEDSNEVEAGRIRRDFFMNSLLLNDTDFIEN